MRFDGDHEATRNWRRGIGDDEERLRRLCSLYPDSRDGSGDNDDGIKWQAICPGENMVEGK